MVLDSPIKSLLIVDDEQEVHVMTKLVLSDYSYQNITLEFLSAYSGEEAKKLIAEHPDAALILLDVMMPDMDGFDVCRTIKGDMSTQHIPVIFITAKTETDDIVQGFEVGGADYITKPFKSPELLARVKMQAEMKILRGLLPICSNCKDIRDDRGIWKRIEEYLLQHPSALFSHGICPKCMKKLYGDEEWYEAEHEE